MKAIILAGGQGNKIWPYDTYRNKTMIKIGNIPLVDHIIQSLNKVGLEDVIIGAVKNVQDIKNYYRNNLHVVVEELVESKGTGDTLFQLAKYLEEPCAVFFGDCFIFEEDIIEFIKSEKKLLVGKLNQDSRNQICLEIDNDGYGKRFWGHPRGHFDYFAAGFILDKRIIRYIECSKEIFNETKVGIGSPRERYLESALNDYLEDGNVLNCYQAHYAIYDIDKPWHIMQVNHEYNDYYIHKIHDRIIGENCIISANAKVHEHVIIGNNCYIGDQVIIGEGCVIEDNTKIDNGAILGKGVHVGESCKIENYCQVGDYTSIGNQCIIGHATEIIEGVLFDKVYLYHYGEYFGVIGTHTDLGAGTVCGTLRFDDGETTHCIKGKREVPLAFSNCSFLGDYSRTGVGAILLPGCKVGSKSVVGSGVILKGDLEDNTLIYPKQELCKVPWGDHKYGW